MNAWLIIVPKLPANGMAIFPFILLKNKAQSDDHILINHEKIHLQQQLELLVLPFYIIYIFHYLINLIHYKNHHQAYLHIVFELEAYRFDGDLNYLHNRKFLAWITNK